MDTCTVVPSNNNIFKVHHNVSQKITRQSVHSIILTIINYITWLTEKLKEANLELKIMQVWRNNPLWAHQIPRGALTVIWHLKY